MSLACTFVIFGVTGNLAREKLLPALYHLEQAQRLPQRMAILGIGRRPWDTAQWRGEVRELLPGKLRVGLDEAVLAAYGWEPGLSDGDLLESLLALNLARGDTAVRGAS